MNMDEKLLINEFIKDRKVGAIASTSNQVTKKMLNKIDFEKANVFVEYGPGNGAITKQLLYQMKKDAFLFVFETNEKFIDSLISINDKRLIIINDDAENAQPILKNRYKIEKVDYIISTIPFTLFNRNKRKRIIYKSYALLDEKGKFITHQYSWLIYYLIKEKFAAANLTTTLLNIPPAFILVGVK